MQSITVWFLRLSFLNVICSQGALHFSPKFPFCNLDSGFKQTPNPTLLSWVVSDGLSISYRFSAMGWPWVLLSAFALWTTFVVGIVPLILKAFTKPVSLNRIIFWAIKHTKFGLVGSFRGRLCHGFHQAGVLTTCCIKFSWNFTELSRWLSSLILAIMASQSFWSHLWNFNI